ncbi:hypothetical protein [Paenibacillus sp. URB8-2]|uniref:hypothetical protein n=1 Tax=Paenibacillus sp. URB8-2 TaxID=2741301 RepID=UPI0015B9D689|nr:hypothetical protein [Paenibacillus sp. URB8-2]
MVRGNDNAEPGFLRKAPKEATTAYVQWCKRNRAKSLQASGESNTPQALPG